jgi:hypothetical protein
MNLDSQRHIPTWSRHIRCIVCHDVGFYCRASPLLSGLNKGEYKVLFVLGIILGSVAMFEIKGMVVFYSSVAVVKCD